MKKKIVFCMTILACLLLVTASALSEGGYTYTVENGYATITAYNGGDRVVVVPDTLGGYKVKAVGAKAFSGFDIESNQNIISITLPSGVETIGNRAFYNCTALETVVLPDTVTDMGYFTFDCCIALKNVVLPSGITVIGADAFFQCVKLEKIVIPEGVVTIMDDAFGSCVRLNEVVLPTTLQNIGAFAFAGCYNLVDITLPDGLLTIEASAFSDCSSLKRITVSGSVSVLAPYAFEGCTELEEVVLENGIKKIQGGVFEDCTSLTKLVIPESLYSIGEYGDPFDYCEKLESVTILGKTTKVINDSFLNLSDDFVLTCYRSTPAAAFALENGITVDYITCKAHTFSTWSTLDSGRQSRTCEECNLVETIADCDINGDGEINVADVIIVIKQCSNGVTDSKYDINIDGEITLLDAIKLIKYFIVNEE